MNEDIREVKNALRTQMKQQRREMDALYKQRCDEKIFEKLKNLWAFRSCDTVFAYLSTPIEVGTQQIIRYCLDSGRKVAVPKCTQVNGEMIFYYIDGTETFQKGRFGVLEPEEDEKKLADLRDGLCLVPALSYDKNGYRLGYGKGYYDRFLSVFGGQAVGLCYEECMSESIAHGRYDKKINTVVTDKRISISR